MSSKEEYFAQNGYWCTPEPIFSPYDVEQIIQHFDRVRNGHYDLHRAPNGVNDFGTLQKIANAWWSDSIIRRVVLDPYIGRLAAELLGEKEIYLWADSLYWKAPHSSAQNSVVGWHQDKQYWFMTDTEQMLTACVALYNADSLSGGLRFAVGSNQWGLVSKSEAFEGPLNEGGHARPVAPRGKHWHEVCPPLEPGQISFHHCLTYHGSGPNLSSQERRSITIHMTAERGLNKHIHPRLWPV